MSRLPSHRRRYAYGVVIIVFGLLAGIGIAETLIRARKWTPPAQIVRGFGLHDVDGVPVWEQATDRYNRACVDAHPERTRILFFGSSITFGVELTAEETFTSGLETLLNALRPTPGFCVLNFAQPGFSFEQKYVVARAEVARYRPALIMWEDWKEWRDYRLIGDTAYGIGDLRVRPDGFIGMRGVPDALNRLLFLHSRVYESLTLLFGERAPEVYGPPELKLLADQRLVELIPLAQSVGARLVLYPAPPLDQPFAETAASLPDWHQAIVDFAMANGIPVFPLQRELVDQDYLALRLDPCCHLNAAAHRALVPIMARIILEQLDDTGRDARAHAQ